MAASFAEQLAAFAVAQRTTPPPAAALAAAKLRLLDGLGVALAALGAPSVPRTRATLGLFGDQGPASAIGVAGGCPPAAAVLHNGLLMHGLEFDDTHIGAIVHGAPVILPPVLAVAERDGAPGADVLAAICVGWEVLARIGGGLRGALQAAGFQAMSVVGPLAAAAAVAHLTKLDARRTAAALGIAGSQSSGIFEFLSDGSSSKALHGGWAALGGLVAATLASDGMTGPATILEGARGLFAAFARDRALAARLADGFSDLGTRWAVTETRAKLAPCCHYVAAFLECLDEILASGVAATDIASITCLVDPGQAGLICEPWPAKQEPPTGYAAKWALPYCLAARALRGAVDVALFEQPIDPTLVAFARKITWEPCPDGFPDRYPGRLRVTLTDGQVREAHVPDVIGAPDRPLAPARLIEKCRANAATALSTDDTAALLDRLDGLERAPSLRPLGELLRRARPDSNLHPVALAAAGGSRA
jgi:2-methylcitrate dehydratase PrpD